jgi:NAD(P)H-hydrate epimerase
MAEIDRKVPERYGISISRMMENAGYQIAKFIRDEIDPNGISIYVGKGNNGGDALVAARRLKLWGYKVEIVLASNGLDGIRKEEIEILRELNVEINLQSSENNYKIALEGLIGYNLQGNPQPPFDSIIKEINREYNEVISIDIPTGVFPDTGERADPSVEADYTLTLAMPKKGMNQENSGEIWVVDISIPPQAYEEFGFKGDIFEEKSLVRLSNKN